jgi:hypothetical protein
MVEYCSKRFTETSISLLGDSYISRFIQQSVDLSILDFAFQKTAACKRTTGARSTLLLFWVRFMPQIQHYSSLR